jgi:hypothetical protein
VDRPGLKIADPDLSRDVLSNLERLLEADRLMETARGLACAGYVWEALECYDLVCRLCPGSSFEDRVCQAVAELFAQCSDGSEEAEADGEGQDDWAKDSACPRCEKLHAKHRAAVRQQVAGLMKACRLHMEAGRQERAAELAREAYALDPDTVTADPLVYKMLLLADKQAKRGAASHRPGRAVRGESPAPCPVCPAAVRLATPPLPPVDPGVVAALERVLDESAKAAKRQFVVVEGTGPEEEQQEHPAGEAGPVGDVIPVEVEEVESSGGAPGVGWQVVGELLSAEVVKTLREGYSVNLPHDVCVEVGAGRQGLRLFCRVPWNGHLFHLAYGPDGFDAWVTPDGGSR